jgi:hypothetical protein
MTERQESAAQFPICFDRAAFDNFLSRQGRISIWGPREINALLCAQPFALHDELTAYGAELATTLDDEYRISELARLNRLSNLDKHRRLPLLAWYADIIYMTGDQPGCAWTQRKSAGGHHLFSRHLFRPLHGGRPDHQPALNALVQDQCRCAGPPPASRSIVPMTPQSCGEIRSLASAIRPSPVRA